MLYQIFRPPVSKYASTTGTIRYGNKIRHCDSCILINNAFFKLCY